MRALPSLCSTSLLLCAKDLLAHRAGLSSIVFLAGYSKTPTFHVASITCFLPGLPETQVYLFSSENASLKPRHTGGPARVNLLKSNPTSDFPCCAQKGYNSLPFSYLFLWNITNKVSSSSTSLPCNTAISSTFI